MSIVDAIVFALLGALAGWLVPKLWGRREKQTPAPVQSSEPALTESEMRAALTVGETEPWWRAIMQCIDVQRAACDAEALDIDHAGTPQASYYAGGAAHLDTLKAFLCEQRAAGLKTIDDAE